MRAYIAHMSSTCVEVRIVDGPRRPPQVSLMDTEGNDVLQTNMTVHETHLAGGYRYSFKNLSQGTEYVANIDSPRCPRRDSSPSLSLTFRTIDPTGLGKRRLRLGILTDPHINTYGRDGKRLYGSAGALLQKYARKLAMEHKVDRIIFPGDVCDSGTKQELAAAKAILDPIREETGVPMHVIIGNHECNPQAFAEALVPESPKHGYYSVDSAGVNLILLATDEQDSLDDGTLQLDWLRNHLAWASKCYDTILVFMHYSLVLHPLHNNGAWDDGMQLLDNSKGALDLLHSFQQVKMVICGHKNVPSAYVDSHGLLHTLSPQLIQVPCGYDIIEIYEKGVMRYVYEIEEMHLQDVSRKAAGEKDASERWGENKHRAFKFIWGERVLQ